MGDRLTSDVLGAEAVGIPTALVRNPGVRTKRECFSLLELADEIEQIQT
jgi:ribonucleotide monophosphatase NagD (HAD superfamily)